MSGKCILGVVARIKRSFCRNPGFSKCQEKRIRGGLQFCTFGTEADHDFHEIRKIEVPADLVGKFLRLIRDDAHGNAHFPQRFEKLADAREERRMRYAACGVVPEKLEPHGGVFRIRRFHIECGFEELRRTVARGFSQAFERQRFEPSCNAHVVDGASKIGCSIDERSVKIEKEKAAAWEDMTVEEHMDLYLEQGMDRKDAMKQVAKDRGISKRDVYQVLVERKL